jgi:hypothetical protein
MDLITIVSTAAISAGVPPALLLSICFQESGLTNKTSVVDGSSASYGVCQVKLNTARMFNKSAHPSHLFSPERNARYAALYLAYQLKRYRYNTRCAVIAYNRGSAKSGCEFDSNIDNLHTKYSKDVFKHLEAKTWTRLSEHSRPKKAQKTRLKSTKEHSLKLKTLLTSSLIVSQ